MQLIKKTLLLLLVCISGCKKTADADLYNNIVNVPEHYVAKSKLTLMPLKGQWYYNNKPYNGFATLHNKNGVLIECVGFVNGKREGVLKKWFDNGNIQKVSFYKENSLTGVTKVWWPNHKIAAEFNYSNGKKHGLQKRWYKNGQLFKQRNLVMGKEEGMQKAWLENGKIYVNYEAKNGRIFGMNRANLCYKLKKENPQYD